jgi:hypothetical protein
MNASAIPRAPTCRLPTSWEAPDPPVQREAPEAPEPPGARAQLEALVAQVRQEERVALAGQALREALAHQVVLAQLAGREQRVARVGLVLRVGREPQVAPELQGARVIVAEREPPVGLEPLEAGPATTSCTQTRPFKAVTVRQPLQTFNRCRLLPRLERIGAPSRLAFK